MKKMTALFLALLVAAGASGCGKPKKSTNGESAGLPAHVNELGNEYDCIDDMPDWTGDKFEVTVWYGYGSNDAYIGKKAKDDKFRDELERVTGVRLSEAKSFDNGGSTGDTKLAKMVATNSYPHVGVGVEASIAQSLIDADQLYNLEEMIPKYMTNYMKIVDSDPEIRAQYDRKTQNSGRYGHVQNFSKDAFKFYDPDYSDEKYASLIQPTDSKAWIWVRDDILQQVRPGAKSQKEIQQIYLDNGKYQASDLTDVVIHSKEEFRTLLEDINALNLTEDGRKIWPFYTHTGEDNWDLMSMLGVPLAGRGIPDSMVSCFSYFDGNEDKMKNTMKEPWFKELMQFYNQLIIDGLASKEALVDTKSAFDQKKMNGEYAVLYGNTVPPTDEQLAAAGKKFSYRRVMIDVPADYNQYVRPNTRNVAFASYYTYLFKANMNETQAEQFLRFLDFFYSEAGMKFANWGPKKAGLYTEDAEGNMKYTDDRFAAAQLYNGDLEVLTDYGITSFPRLDFFFAWDGVNKYQPELIYANYEEERVASNYKNYWNYGYFEPLPDFPTMEYTWAIWSFPHYVNGVSTFWNARQSIEDAMKTVFTATNQAEFDSYYNKMLSVAESNGFTDATLDEMTKTVKEQNGDLFDNLANWKLK